MKIRKKIVFKKLQFVARRLISQLFTSYVFSNVKHTHTNYRNSIQAKLFNVFVLIHRVYYVSSAHGCIVKSLLYVLHTYENVNSVFFRLMYYLCTHTHMERFNTYHSDVDLHLYNSLFVHLHKQTALRSHRAYVFVPV